MYELRLFAAKLENFCNQNATGRFGNFSGKSVIHDVYPNLRPFGTQQFVQILAIYTALIAHFNSELLVANYETANSVSMASVASLYLP